MRQNEPILEREVPLEVTELTLPPVEIWQGAWIGMAEDGGPCWAELGFV